MSEEQREMIPAYVFVTIMVAMFVGFCLFGPNSNDVVITSGPHAGTTFSEYTEFFP